MRSEPTAGISISGVAPLSLAVTAVPDISASATTNPNASFGWVGKNRRSRVRRNSSASRSPCRQPSIDSAVSWHKSSNSATSLRGPCLRTPLPGVSAPACFVIRQAISRPCGMLPLSTPPGTTKMIWLSALSFPSEMKSAGSVRCARNRSEPPEIWAESGRRRCSFGVRRVGRQPLIPHV